MQKSYSTSMVLLSTLHTEVQTFYASLKKENNMEFE